MQQGLLTAVMVVCAWISISAVQAQKPPMLDPFQKTVKAIPLGVNTEIRLDKDKALVVGGGLTYMIRTMLVMKMKTASGISTGILPLFFPHHLENTTNEKVSGKLI